MMIMLVLPMPYTLCASQFTTATVVMFLIGRQYGTYNGRGGGGDVRFAARSNLEGLRFRRWPRFPRSQRLKANRPGAAQVHRGHAALLEEAGPGLVERFDIESYSDFSAKSSNFRGLVLGCIKADFCDQILIFQHFARSRRYAILCTAQISKLQKKVGKKFVIFWKFVQISANNGNFFTFFSEICIDFDDIFSEFR